MMKHSPPCGSSRKGRGNVKQVQIQIGGGENFTPASLMKRYADQTGATFTRDRWGRAELVIDGQPYEYHHWSITSVEGVETVTLHLAEVGQ